MKKDQLKTQKKKLTWISKSNNLIDVDLVYYNHLLILPKLIEDMDYMKYVNFDSKHTYPAFGDSNLKSLKNSEHLQLERIGYFICEQSLKENKIILFNTPEGGSEEKKEESK